MIAFEEQYALWDAFLKVWPSSRLATMTLEEYTQAGSKNSFTYWIESRLDGMGSIWGGSAFKFGVFSRKDTEGKESDAKLSYSDTHGWYSSLGSTAEEAFDNVRGYVVQVAELAARGDLEGIEAFKQLGDAFKWKIAFHYQNSQAPLIVNIFKRAPLAVYIGETAGQQMAALQKTVLQKKPDALGILEFGHQIWADWSRKNLPIWKLSHGTKDFTAGERQNYLDAELGVMYGATTKSQGDNFEKAPVGTLFYLCQGNEKLVLVGQFTSAPMPCDKDSGWLQRHYRTLKKAVKAGAFDGPKKGWAPNYPSTFMRVPQDDLPQFETKLLAPFFGTDLAELAALAGEPIDVISTTSPPATTSAAVSKVASKPVGACLNRIYYGPPGTGKTFKLNRLIKSEYEQDVSSLSATEWRRQFIAAKIAVLTWWEIAAAVLHDLNSPAKVAQIVAHEFVQAAIAAKAANRTVQQTLWATMQSHTVDESVTVKLATRVSPAVFDKFADSVWQLAGDWRDACADVIALVDQLKQGPQGGSLVQDEQDNNLVQRYSFVTFHQSYGYEEFVEGLRPVLRSDAEPSNAQAGEVETGEVAYEIRPGVFKELCRKARLAPDRRFAIVIDEINRGNISKIFGELITLIEPDKRDPLDGSPPPFEVTLAYSGKKFSVPANVDIIGTMNTADRSLALLDTALRRRFEFVPLMPDTRAEKDPADPHSAPLSGLLVTTVEGVIDVRKLLETMNARIEALYDRDHCVGHAYLTGLVTIDDGPARFEQLTQTFRKRIVPLLEEYFFEDWRKIRLVLGDNQKQDATTHFVGESDAHEQDLVGLFGNNHGLDSYATKRRYSVQEVAFSKPAAYLGVYLTLA